jgi:hypothetical protein
MRNLKLYEEFEGEEFEDNKKYNELDSDQDFDVEVEFHEYINDWEKENAIPMTKNELKIQFSTEAIESVINQFHNKENKTNPNEIVKSKLAQLAEIDSPLSKFFETLKSKCDWYDDSYAYAIISKIYVMILQHDEAEDVEWSQDDDEYMAVTGGEEENDDLEVLRQRSYKKYAQEDEIKRRKDEIFNKVADGKPLSDEELDFWKRNESKKIKRFFDF